MTEPVQDNPYGVRVPGGTRSLPGAAAPPMDDYPLVPWEEESHTRQWVDVDHTREQLARFESTLARLADLVTPGVDQGRLVIVSGPRGMGKTTLIHQCIHRARQHIVRLSGAAAQAARSTAPGGAVAAVPRHIVAMTAGYRNDGAAICIDENGDFAATPAINTNIRDKICDALHLHFGKDQIGPARAQESPFKAFGAISALLAQQDALLFAVIPHIDWTDAGVRTKFLKTCLSHAQTRIVLFVEVSHETNEAADAVVAELMPSSAVTHLALGHLGPEDTLKFRSAHSGHRDADLPSPDRDDLMTAHTLWGPADVRELRQVFYAAAEHQRQSGSPARLTSQELSRHWPRLPDLRRTVPDPPTGS